MPIIARCVECAPGTRNKTHDRGGNDRPRYIRLYNFTDQGIRTIREWPQRLEAARRVGDGAGAGQIYLTMGQYDLVSIGEAASDEEYAANTLALGTVGNVRTTTLRAFNEEEAKAIIASMPSG